MATANTQRARESGPSARPIEATQAVAKAAHAGAYFPALDGLRLFCFSAVVVSHAFIERRIGDDVGHPLHAFVASLGEAGVDVFFALSGFLITGLLLSELKRDGKVSLTRFYARRTLRIWPVYYVALAVGFGLAALMGDRFTRPFAIPFSSEIFTRALPLYVVFVANWSDAAVPSCLGVLWSVSIEEQFYILFPPTFARSKRRTPALVPILVGLVVAWVVRAYLASRGAPSHTILRNTFAHADHLLLGALLAQLTHVASGRAMASLRRLATLAEVPVVAAFVVFVGTDHSAVSSVPGWLAYIALSAFLSASIIGVFAFGNGVLARGLSRQWPRYLGGLTYAGYVFHMYALVVVWAVCRPVHTGPWSEASLRAVLAIALTLVIAYASKMLLERPFMKLKSRFAST